MAQLDDLNANLVTANGNLAALNDTIANLAVPVPVDLSAPVAASAALAQGIADADAALKAKVSTP